MIPKIILPHRFDGEPAATFYTEPAALTKTAFSTNDELSAFMGGFTKKKDHGYILVCALGAYEAHGPNNNFDSFDIPNLIPQHQNTRRPYGISTFVTHGKVFRSHNNKPNSPVFGSIAKAFWNPVMLRIELLLELPCNLNTGELADIESGKDVAWSMGTRVSADRCSWCGNVAPTRREYCNHLKTQLGHIREDGTICHMQNIEPQFFDISIVRIPADKTAFALMKVASGNQSTEANISIENEYSSLIYRQTVLNGRSDASYLMQKFAGLPESVKMAEISASPIKKSSQRKTADIDKLVEADTLGRPGLQDLYTRFRRDGMSKLRASEVEMQSPHVDELHDAFGGDTKSLLSTLAAYGVILKPAEYQRLMLGIMGKKDERAALDESKETILDAHPALHPDDVTHLDHHLINHDHAEALEDLIAAKSYHRGGMLERVRAGNHRHDEPVDEAAESPWGIDMDGQPEHEENPLLNRLGGGFEDYARKAMEFGRQVAKAAETVFPGKKLTIRLGLHDGADKGLPMVALGAPIKEAAEDMERVYGPLSAGRIKAAAAALKKTAEIPFPVIDGIIMETLS